MQVKKQQLELDMDDRLVTDRERSTSRLYTVTLLRLDEAQAGIKIAWRIINNLRYADDIIFMAEIKEELKSLLMKVKEEREKVAKNSTFRKLRSWHPVPSLQGK